MKFLSSVCCYLLFSAVQYGQVGGENVYQFLNLATSARQVALGGEVLTLMDDVNQPIWNPSVINQEMDNQLSVNYSSYLGGINIGSLSYARLISRRFGTIHGSISYLNYGTLIGADEQGNETGNFSASDLAISVGYARNLPWTNLFFGANVKLINSSISNFTSYGIATDFGVLYYSPYKPYSFTVVVRNVGTQVKSFANEIEELPSKVAIGASYRLEHVPLKWYLTVDNLQQWAISVPNPSEQTTDLEGNITNENVGFLSNAMRHFVVGAELFPESAINIRLGYNFRRAAELKLQNVRTFGGISFGFGLKMNNFKFNYAYSKFHSATNASTFSLQIDLDKR
ncbi:MAG: type IX secretion system protein PorQ [Flavobacteriia bacterium]|nr:type IX secretion system protein PorQ [Flavobacteriia bacterium]OIP47132.1 MAG: penicillin-binding protein [Flavobacteriaceae bacterium CG2_30_31_66]PIV96408.1 MAG: penicillin-binding protein [Flavobacteriaceae bacterium CG17_big_fil_post_rev_8_21_14_2_50_31_13]PIY16373.1 MAG: penicillin-binding protein [Flavobacteriaceae bacterium CG_4_10_14_3_um_filter_31_253]PIZ11378.1 MAG: penicillin-binding protein [Flavobacteriaceae bacterium CG_4_10_14_0_8_um_filter_31_99]PJC10988.1 MAG: penicillin-b